MFTLDESCHSHLSNTIHSRYRSHLPPRNTSSLCAELEPLCTQTFSRPYRDLSSLCFYAPREIHFSSFIQVLAHISITCLFLLFNAPRWNNRAQPWSITVSRVNVRHASPTVLLFGGGPPQLLLLQVGVNRGVRRPRQGKGKLDRS